MEANARTLKTAERSRAGRITKLSSHRHAGVASVEVSEVRIRDACLGLQSSKPVFVQNSVLRFLKINFREGKC